MEILGELLFGVMIIMVTAYIAHDIERREP